MAVSFVATGTAAGGSGGATPQPGIPSGCAAGDVLLCTVYTREMTDGSVRISEGWNQIYQTRDTGGILAIFGRRWESGDTAPTLTPINHTSGAGGDSIVGVISAWRGVDLANPIAQLGTAYTATTTQNIGAITGITTGAAGAAVLVIGGKSAADSYSVLTGDSLTWVETADANTTVGADASIVVNHALTPSAAQAIANKTYTGTTVGSLARGIMVELKPAAEDGGSLTGWTTFTASVDTRKVYVSSSLGSDSNDGLSETTPKQTIAAGVALMRDGYPDWLLFRCGDTFSSGIGQWLISGRSATERMLIGSYGIGARPKFNTDTSSFLFTASGGGSPASISYLAVVDIEATAENYVGTGSPNGILFGIASNSNLVEGCRIYNYEIGIGTTGSTHTAIQFRRNVSTDCYASSGTVGHNMYLAGCAGDSGAWENVLDKGGDANPTVFRHNLYAPEGGAAITVRRNISARSSSHGANIRVGGTITDNLFLRCSVAMYASGQNSGGAAARSVDVTYNVVLDGKDIDGSNLRGHALTMDKVVGSNAQVKNNIFAHQVTGTGPAGITIQSGTFTGVDINGNVVYKWEATSPVQATAAQLAGSKWRNNQFDQLVDTDDIATWNSLADAQAMTHSGNRYHRPVGDSTPIWAGGSRTVTDWGTLTGDTSISSAADSYPDPERTIATYVEDVLGVTGGDIDDFIDAAKLQRRYSWRPEYTAEVVNAYVRDGFGVSGPPSSSPRILGNPTVVVAAVKAAAISRN